jgi:nucleotide-binding universal stress UspA family protein
MYETILVPLDGSGRAEAIIAHVREMAQHMDSQLVLLRVVDPAAFIAGMESLPVDVSRNMLQQEVETAQNYLSAKCSELAAQKIKVRAVVRSGPIVQEIIDTAEAEGADLIAIASHGRTGMARLFYGSVAAGVLHRIDRPLLLIRADG